MFDPFFRERGVCGEIGPPPAPDMQPYMCSRDVGHNGAHKATICGLLVDSWPAAV